MAYIETVMKKFTLEAEAEFIAEDIDDALRKLAEHFLKVSEGKRSDLLIGGKINIGYINKNA